MSELQQVPTQPEALSQSEYLETLLHRHEVSDQAGLTRPAYDIAGREVMFRNRQETAFIPDRSYQIPEGPGQDRLPVGVHPASDTESADFLASGSAVPEALIVSANTPEGLLETAALLRPDKHADYDPLATEMSQGIYGSEATALLDKIGACLYMNEAGDTGTLTQQGYGYVRGVNLDGYALVTAALTGDVAAEQLVERRVADLHRNIASRAVANMAIAETAYQEWVANNRSSETLPSNQVALVHSTAHAIERDASGNVILYPSAVKRPDKYPRATLHFTSNSQVTDHYAGSWGDQNSLIVTNLANMIDANGTPSAMNSIDTYFSCNPGEHLTLPGALIVEPAATDTLLTGVLEQDAAGIRYKSATEDSYTPAERSQVEGLAREYGLRFFDTSRPPTATMLREVALRQALRTQGVEVPMMTTAGAHYSTNQRFNNAYTTLAHELGVVFNGLHTYGSDADMESTTLYPDADAVDENPEVNQEVVHTFNLTSLRHVVASGYMPTRHARPSSFFQAWDDHGLVM